MLSFRPWPAAAFTLPKASSTAKAASYGSALIVRMNVRRLARKFGDLTGSSSVRYGWRRSPRFGDGRAMRKKGHLP